MRHHRLNHYRHIEHLARRWRKICDSRAVLHTPPAHRDTGQKAAHKCLRRYELNPPSIALLIVARYTQPTARAPRADASTPGRRD